MLTWMIKSQLLLGITQAQIILIILLKGQEIILVNLNAIDNWEIPGS